MKNYLMLLFILIITAVFPVYSQDLQTVEEIDAQDEAQDIEEINPEHTTQADDNLLYVITDFIFDINGRTRPEALIRNGEFKKGIKIQGRASLENYIAEKTQMLVNQRVLKDNVRISYSVGVPATDNTYPVTLTIKAEETWNIIMLPKPEYSTNTGFDLTLKARDYNFLGSMNPLRIDLGYSYDENKHSSFNFELDTEIPFRAFGYNWKITEDNIFSYRPQVEEPFYYRNSTGLSMELPFRATTFTFGFLEYFTINEENADRYKARYGDFQNGFYMTSKLYTSWKIPTGLKVLDFGELTYTPELSASFNHEFSKWPLDEFRKGPFLNFNHTLGFEKTDWHANYRSGLSAGFGNSYSYDFYRLNQNREPLSIYFTLYGIGHFIQSNWFAFSTQIRYRHWFYHDPEYYEQAGDYLRGIANKAICSDYMLSLNADFPFRVLLFTPSKWFNTSKLKLFDFELQISPIIDMAMYHDPKAQISFNPKNIAVTGGIEFILFPAFFRSFYARLSLGCNLREMITARPFKLPSGENREIFFGLGHFY